MKNPLPRLRPVALLLGVVAAAAAAACGAAREPRADGGRAVAPAPTGRAAAERAAPPPAQPAFTAADVQFMQDMIVHHRQAMHMTGLVAQRTASDDVRLLARRIEASQQDELELMERWLRERGQAVPAEHAHHGGHGAVDVADSPMPGMLTAAQLARLEAARGAEFDRLFLEAMIFHHEGALAMVRQLFATEGGGQATEMFQFASHVDSDQRIEIARMRRMLQAGR